MKIYSQTCRYLAIIGQQKKIELILIGCGVVLLLLARFLVAIIGEDPAWVEAIAGLVCVIAGISTLAPMPSFKFEMQERNGRWFNGNWYIARFHSNMQGGRTVTVLHFRVVLTVFVCTVVCFGLQWWLSPLAGLALILSIAAQVFGVFTSILLIIWIVSQVQFLHYNQQRKNMFRKK